MAGCQAGTRSPLKTWPLTGLSPQNRLRRVSNLYLSSCFSEYLNLSSSHMFCPPLPTWIHLYSSDLLDRTAQSFSRQPTNTRAFWKTPQPTVASWSWLDACRILIAEPIRCGDVERLVAEEPDHALRRRGQAGTGIWFSFEKKELDLMKGVVVCWRSALFLQWR